jgi:hypothetical protein
LRSATEALSVFERNVFFDDDGGAAARLQRLDEMLEE